MTELLQYSEPMRRWLTAIGAAALIFLSVWLLKPMLLRRLDKLAARTTTHVDDMLAEALRGTRLWLVAVFALSLGLQILQPGAGVQRMLKGAATLALFLQLGLWIRAMWLSWIRRSRAAALQSDAGAATSLSALGFIGEIVLWAVLVLVALDNLGVNITTLIAGLGVGGVAVALAVQNILGDLFASLSIVIDKPFVIGDFIIVDDYMGTVENVGLKTTRIRSLGGEQIVFSNSDLLKGRVRNYKRMYERRVVFGFGVLYQTPPERLERIPALVRSIIEKQQTVRFDRAHCAKFGDSSIDFEVVYWVLSPDYNLYMDIQQAINFALKRELAQLGVDFAYPTRSVFIERPIALKAAAG